MRTKIPNDIRKMARDMKIPVFQHHITVHSNARITIMERCVNRAKLSVHYSVQIVDLGHRRAYLVFTYDPDRHYRGHLRIPAGRHNAYVFYNTDVYRHLNFYSEGHIPARFRLIGKPSIIQDTEGRSATIVWRISVTPVKDIASAVESALKTDMNLGHLCKTHIE